MTLYFTCNNGRPSETKAGLALSFLFKFGCLLLCQLLWCRVTACLTGEKIEGAWTWLRMCWCCGLISENLPPPPSPEVGQGTQVPNEILEGLHAFSRPFPTSLFVAFTAFGLLYGFEVIASSHSKTNLYLWYFRNWYCEITV